MEDFNKSSGINSPETQEAITAQKAASILEAFRDVFGHAAFVRHDSRQLWEADAEYEKTAEWIRTAKDTVQKTYLLDGCLYDLILPRQSDSGWNFTDTASHANEQDMEIIRILASEYSSVYYIDLDTEALTPYTMNEQTENRFSPLLKNMKYSEAFRLYVDMFVYDADKEMMLNAGSVANIQKQLQNQKTFITTFRTMDENGVRFSEMKFVKVGDENDIPHGVALGFADKDQEITAHYVDMKLMSEYISIMLVDMESDTYRMITHSASSRMQDMQSGCYSKAVHDYADYVADDYRDLWLNMSNIEYIKRYLAKEDRREFSYILNQNEMEPEWRRCVVQVVERKNGVPSIFILSYLAIDTASSAALDVDVKHKRDMEIINILASEYSSVYYIELDSGMLTPYTMNEETENEFGPIFRSGISFSEAYEMYVKSLVYPEDQKKMLSAGSVDNIIHELKNRKSFLTTYRSNSGGSPRYCEMKFVKVGNQNDAPSAVALGFADKDEIIRAELERESQNRRNNEIIEILASEYTSVYYIDLTTDELTPYSMNTETESQFGVLFKNMTYSNAFRMYVDRMIVSEDKPMMLKAGSIGNIMKELRYKKTFLTTYRSDNNGNPHYCEMKFVKVGGTDGIPTAVALGFADKDEELRKRVEQETLRQRNTDIIEILASEYTSVYYIDLTTDELDPYTMNDETETEFGSVFRSGIRYTDAFKMYVNTLVYEEDRRRMLRAGSIYNILAELQDKKTFITTYRSDNNGDPHYCEMKFVKVGDDDNPQAVALGFTDRNDEIRNEMKRKAENDRNFEIIRILASEYTSVYFIDMLTDDLEPYTMNEDTETQFGQTFRSGIRYSDAFKMYVDRFIAEADKPMMLKAGSPENISRELRDKKTFTTTYRSEQNGSVRYCEMKFVKVGAEDAEPTAVALGFADKDEEIRMEIEHNRQADFITVLSDDYDAVFFVHLDNNYIQTVRLSDEYLHLNRTLTEKMTYTQYLDEIDRNSHFENGRELKEFLLPESVIRELNASHAVFKNYSMISNGTTIYYQVKLVRTPSWFETHEFIFGVHNMDELMKTQIAQENELAEARNRAEAASRSKSMFLSNMSHDIRTPMNAIIGFAELARKYIGDDARVEDCLNKVLTSSHHLLNLINDVLDMSRIESGKVEIHEEPVSIRDILESVVTISNVSAQSKNIFLTFHPSALINKNIYGDKLRLSEIALNILSNAVKYTNPGGKIDVELNEAPDKKPGRIGCELIVSDTGIGMSKEFLEKVFNPFERSRTTTVSGIQGTGLGMSITKQLVEKMGGTIKIESEEGIGTTVTIHFSFREAKASEVKSTAHVALNPQNLKGKHVLLVEDNELNREIGTELLEEHEMIVHTAEDGTVAVDILQKAFERGEKRPFDVVLMDIQMPKMDGYQATREIRKLYPQADHLLPIYALSANAFDEDRRQALEAGMDGHLSKPIVVDELLRLLSDSL